MAVMREQRKNTLRAQGERKELTERTKAELLNGLAAQGVYNIPVGMSSS